MPLGWVQHAKKNQNFLGKQSEVNRNSHEQVCVWASTLFQFTGLGKATRASVLAFCRKSGKFVVPTDPVSSDAWPGHQQQACGLVDTHLRNQVGTFE